MYIEQDIVRQVTKFLEQSDIYYQIAYKKKYAGLTRTEIHCLMNIFELENPNVTNIAAAMRMTRGGITKLSSKLVEKQYIEKFKKKDNKKEVHFKLTATGRELYDIHKLSHDRAIEEHAEKLKCFSEKEQDTISAFLAKYTDFLVQSMNEIEGK